jgi:hypothetical protein
VTIFLNFLQLFVTAQVQVPLFACLMCVVLMASAATAQRPFYAPNPWHDRYGQQDQNGAGSAGGGGSITTSTRAPPTARPPGASSSGSFGGLTDRFLTPADGSSVSFRFYNNVPIQGPETPCVGCTYMLTKNGFVRQF